MGSLKGNVYLMLTQALQFAIQKTQTLLNINKTKSDDI
jgi:hypothetical protein